jgi:hypothetical protein
MILGHVQIAIRQSENALMVKESIAIVPKWRRPDRNRFRIAPRTEENRKQTIEEVSKK